MVTFWTGLFAVCLFQIAFPLACGSTSYDGSIKKSEAYTTCPKGWFSYGDMCYKAGGNINGGVEFPDAKAACEKENGQLATVNSQELQDFLSAFLLVPEQSSLWIGLEDRENETIYKWLDGTPYNFSNFMPTEPSEFLNDIEDCMEMVYQALLKWIGGKMGQWNDIACSHRTLPYLCQKEKAKKANKTDYRWVFASSVPVLDPRYCETEKGLGWRFEESCFYLVPLNKTWTKAEEHCAKEFKGHLATLDYRTNYFINYVFRDVTEEMWIGVKIKEETQQRWSSGWFVTFENWGKQEKYVEGTCALLSANGSWILQSCQKKTWFICEYTTSKAVQPTLTPSKENTHCPKESKGSIGWRDFGGDFCYFLVLDESIRWFQAEFFCNKLGGTLATIPSQIEMDILFYFVRYYPYYRRFHIGYFRPLEDADEFVWVDGSNFTFTRWTKGEPNNKNEADHCTEIMVQNMSWNDVNCYGPNGYICSIPKVKVALNATAKILHRDEWNNSNIIHVMLGVIALFAFLSLLCGVALCHYKFRDRRNEENKDLKLIDFILKSFYNNRSISRNRGEVDESSC